MKVAQSLYLTPSQRQVLQNNLKTNLRPEFRRRIHIMLLADAGESQSQICKKLACSQEAARYWISISCYAAKLNKPRYLYFLSFCPI